MITNFVRQALRKVFLLADAEQKRVRVNDAQRAAMRAYCDAATRRLRVADDLRGSAQAVVGLELRKQGAMLYVRAAVASSDATLDPATLSADGALRRLDEAFATQTRRPPQELDRAKAMWLATDPLAIDQLTPEEVAQKEAEFDAVVQWLSRLFEVRTAGELRRASVLRIGGAIAIAVTALCWLIGWALSPRDIAKHKFAFCSGSTMFSTTPDGAVDGSTSGLYGFHSALEDSPWLAIDLGARYAIDTVKVFGRGDGYFDQSIPLALEASDEGANYRVVDQRATPFSAADPWVTKPANLVARFIRLHTMRQSYLVLGEVEMYGRKLK